MLRTSILDEVHLDESGKEIPDTQQYTWQVSTIQKTCKNQPTFRGVLFKYKSYNGCINKIIRIETLLHM